MVQSDLWQTKGTRKSKRNEKYTKSELDATETKLLSYLNYKSQPSEDVSQRNQNHSNGTLQERNILGLEEVQEEEPSLLVVRA